MIDAIDYWHDRIGRHLAPDSEGFRDALMRAYPHFEKDKVTRMGGSEPARFLVAEDRAQVWAPIATPEPAVGKVEIRPTSTRKRRDWIIDVILDPPPAPFLAASVGMAFGDSAFWRMTVGTDLVVFGGAATLFEGQSLVMIDRNRFVEAQDWFAKNGISVAHLLRYASILYEHRDGRISGAAARKRIAAIKAPVEDMRLYPGAKNAAVMKLAAYAASGWSAAS